MTDPLQEALAAAQRAGATASDAILVEEDSLEAEVRGGEVDRLVRARNRTLGVRLLCGQRTAAASTSDLDPEAIRAVVERARALAEASADDPCAGLPDEAASALPELELHCPETAAIEADAAIDLARRVDAAARERDSRIQPTGNARCTVRSGSVALARSDGFRGEYQTSAIGLGGMPIAEQGPEKQRDYAHRIARSHKELPSPEEIGREAAERCVARLGARKIASQRASLLYEPRTAASLVRHLGDAVLGSAVAEQRSFLAGRIGETLAASNVTIVDDGRLPRGLASRPFDGEGVATRRNELLRGGVLGTYLLDAYHARRLGLPSSTGSARRAARGLPAPGTSNLWLEPGELDRDALVSSTARGLLVTELIGFGVNGVTGDYSRGAAGLWVEDGRVRHAVQEVTVAGNLLEMYAAIDAIASDLTFFGPSGAPTLRIAEATIAGL